MFNRAELKQQAKDQLRGRWGGAIGAFFLVGLVIVAISIFSAFIPFAGFAALIVTGPLAVGLIIYSMALVNTTEKVDVSMAFKGFSIFSESVATYLWMVLWLLLWMLVFYIPVFIKAFSYSQCLFIIADNPRIGARQAMKISMRMTKGYKWKIFVMNLSFIGWALLCIFTLGIGYLWLEPYMQVTYTNMYYKLKALGIESGAVLASEFEV